jgi:hypothetical protein
VEVKGNPWTVTTATAPADKALYQRQIDALVYALYGLTEEEIEIEGGQQVGGADTNHIAKRNTSTNACSALMADIVPRDV